MSDNTSSHAAWESFATLSHDGHEWIARDDDGVVLWSASDLEGALRELAASGGFEVL